MFDWVTIVNVNASMDWDNVVVTRVNDSDVDDLTTSIDWDNATKFVLIVLPNCVVVLLIAVVAAFTTLSVYVIVIAALRNWLNRLDGLDDGASAIYV
jgi:type III secretory pathway component EscV